MKAGFHPIIGLLLGLALILSACQELNPTPPTLTDARPISGVYQGRYVCAQGVTGLTLSVEGTMEGFVSARFDFYAVPENPGVPSGSYTMTGRYYTDSSLLLSPERWIQRPSGYVMVSLSGKILRQGGGVVYQGQVPECRAYQGGWFSLRKLP